MEPSQINLQTYFMEQALKQAALAYEEGEVPVGAVVVHNQRIIAKGYNQTERLQDVTAHAEILAITSAAQYVGAKYLNECTMYVTLEPCTQCIGALVHARVSQIMYAASEPKTGFTRFVNPDLYKKIKIHSGLMAQESSLLLKSFFAQKRKSQ